VAVTSPRTNGNRLSRRWRCTYTLAKAPDLVVEGEARYLFANGLIKEIEEHLSPVSLRAVNDWMKQHGGKLHA